MNTYGKSLKTFVLHPVLLISLLGGAIACQSEAPSTSTSTSSDPSVEVSPSEPSTPQPVPPDQAVYQNEQHGFQFSYSLMKFVVDDTVALQPNAEGEPIAAIDIWTLEHDQEIRSGAYEGGTEYPANVRVSVYSNPQQLPLQQWVEQSNQFGILGEFSDTTVAEQQAIAFSADGLYQNDHLLFPSVDRSNLILITISKNGGEDDALYQQAFDQIVNSFTFNAN